MKAEVTKEGNINIIPETDTEHYAISKVLYYSRTQKIEQVVSIKES